MQNVHVGQKAATVKAVLKQSVTGPTAPIEHAILIFLASFFTFSITLQIPIFTFAVKLGYMDADLWRSVLVNLVVCAVAAFFIAGIHYAVMKKDPTVIHFLRLGTYLLGSLPDGWVGSDTRTSMRVLLNQVNNELDQMEQEEAAQSASTPTSLPKSDQPKAS